MQEAGKKLDNRDIAPRQQVALFDITCPQPFNVRKVTFNDYCMIREQVILHKSHNYCGARRPVPTHLNIGNWRRLLVNYTDSLLCEFLEFGWPINFTADFNPRGVAFNYNHRSATLFSADVDTLLATDVQINALLGPFQRQPFTTPLVCSPLQIVKKQDSAKPRLVVDLSFPIDSSINMGISNDWFLDQPVNLHYPSVLTLAEIVRTKGRGCLMFKTDLAKCYKQFSIQPNDWHYCAISWKHAYYVYIRQIFGLRSSAYACQRVTSAITYLMQQNSYSVCNYLDDLAGAESIHKASTAYLSLQNLLRSLNLIENIDKATPPAVEMEFLGILLNSENFTMTIPPRKLQSIRQQLRDWIHKQYCTLKELQSLIGKLQHLSCCIRGGRIFINRLLNTLRGVNSNHKSHCIEISSEFKQDLKFWFYLMDSFNGVSIMSESQWQEVDTIFSCDASLRAAGAVNTDNKSYFQLDFVSPYLGYPIHILEMLTVILCCKIWGPTFTGRKIRCLSDNMCTVIAVNEGKSKDVLMQKCIRELFYLCTLFSFEIRAVYIETKKNVLPDLLSRFHELPNRIRFHRLTHDKNFKQIPATNSMLAFSHTW